MNRLVIIGNGFDLAHGMPTRYSDFINNYLQKCFEEANENQIYTDELCCVFHNPRFVVEPVVDSKIKKALENNIRMTFNYKEMKSIAITKNLFSYFNNRSHDSEFIISFSNKLLRKITQNVSQKKWVDIESLYYEQLKRHFTSNEKHEIKELNKAFGEIQSLLVNYLIEKENAANGQGQTEIFNSIVEGTDSHSKIMLLSFNYTKKNLEWYVDRLKQQTNVIPISVHGLLGNPNNPIIFGYGDEFDEAYKHIELAGDPEFLRYIKSFGYAITSNYARLNSFISSEVFDILVLGHSCGMSDRVLLKTIFESVKCINIRISYHERPDGTNDFLDVYQNIARQFSLDKREIFRERMVSKEESKSMPQITI